MKKYLTTRQNGIYNRLLMFEQSKKDGSIFIHNMYHLHSKSSYHTNYGAMEPPYQYHLRGCSGDVIEDSVQQRGKLITTYTSAFAKYHFNELPKSKIVSELSEEDVLLDLDTKNFTQYHIHLFSEKRSDLLSNNFENALIVSVPLRYDKIIVGCFNSSN